MNEEEFLDSVSPEEGDQVEQEEIVQDEIQEEVQEEIDPLEGLSPIEQKAYDQGWRPEDQYDGDKANWKSADRYVSDGEWMTKLKERDQRIERVEREMKERLDNQNKLHEMRRMKELDDLKAKQRQAVDDADTDAYDTTQRQIDELQAQEIEPVQPQQPQVDPLITDWVSRNPWINDANDDRSAVAMGALQLFQQSNPNASIQEAINHVEGRVNKMFPTENPRRQQPNTTETGRRPAKRANRELTMNDLTQQERNEWETHGRIMFKNQKDFLQAVKDARAN